MHQVAAQEQARLNAEAKQKEHGEKVSFISY
jgi:hypothetical protein